jgi:protein-S-isoprenylcysteine O-methyltransferase Ste14
MKQGFFYWVCLAESGIFCGIRAAYEAKAHQSRGRAKFKEGRVHGALHLAGGLMFVLTLLTYTLVPSLLEWAEIALPAWLQWVGVVMGAMSVPLIFWVHSALGSNFSVTLHIRDEHTLVVNGPYRWVRHPMYTILYMHLVAVFLLTRNWLIGVVSLIALTTIIIARLKKEEETMIEKFGDQYREYMRRTGRFFPRPRDVARIVAG